MSVPDPLDQPSLDMMASYGAVGLFVARARERRPGFALTERNAAAVAHICARLDGLPLAIELAAARVGNLGVETIVTRLDDCFGLLTAGTRDAPTRQQTLRATLDWSYALLDAREQRLLNRLAVFVGGWLLEAAEAIGAGDGEDPSEVLYLLAGLLNKSLASLEEPDGAPGRYRMLATVRHYAAERLRASTEEASVCDRHLAWYVTLAEQAESKLHGPDQAVWLARLEQEHDNLRAALRWSVAVAGRPEDQPGTVGTGERGNAEQGLRLAAAMRGFWEAHGHVKEGRDWLERLLAVQGQADTAKMAQLRMKALNAAGWLALKLGDYDHAVA